MNCDFDRYYLTADYKKPYCDDGPDFIALSTGIMEETLHKILELQKEWKKDKKLCNFRIHFIPAGKTECFKITLEK